MIERRSVSLIAAQPAISASVRPHPMHRPDRPLTAQTLMQGLEIGGDVTRRELGPAGRPRKCPPLASSKNDKKCWTDAQFYRISISA